MEKTKLINLIVTIAVERNFLKNSESENYRKELLPLSVQILKSIYERIIKI